MGRLLFDSYLILWIASLCLTGRYQGQAGLAVLWLVVMVFLWIRAKQSGMSLKRIVWIGFLAQAPGVIAATLGAWSLAHGGSGVWGNGILELWIHPLLPLLELLPAIRIGKYSDVYIAASFLPIALVLLGVLVWYVSSVFIKICNLSDAVKK